ncbi:MAG TPA: hypothetical protein VJ396_04845 [Acidiferrobacterales bacterium]|nr:hypothetical protein [Acidiferrobacterales bacterium]
MSASATAPGVALPPASMQSSATAPCVALPPRRLFPTPPCLLHPWSRASMQSSKAPRTP